jgi:hypothetical protein
MYRRWTATAALGPAAPEMVAVRVGEGRPVRSADQAGSGTRA